MDAKTQKAVIIGLSVAVIAPLIVDAIRKFTKKSKGDMPANTDHGFVNWVGDEDFLGSEGDRSVEKNPHMSLAPLTSRDAIINFPEFKKYKPFVVSPSKKIKFV